MDQIPLEMIDQIVGNWQRTLTPFLALNSSRNGEILSFGTGFILHHRENTFLVTALHVLEDVSKYKEVFIVVGAKVISLEKLLFSYDTANDVAVALINDLLLSNDITRAKGIKLDEYDQEKKSTKYFLLMGFPSSKNKFHFRKGSRDCKVLSITAKSPIKVSELETIIQDSIFFEFDPKAQINSSNRVIGTSPDLWGMSGGPVLELFMQPIGCSHVQISPKLVGVLSEWKVSKKAIVAASIDALESLLDEAVELVNSLL